MPTLFLSPRHTPESRAIVVPAVDAGWSVRRLHSYQVPADALGKGGAYYGETMFGFAVAPQLGIKLADIAPEWIVSLPIEHRARDVRLCPLRDVDFSTRRFVKCPGEKSFRADVYASAPAGVDPTEMVIAAEPVAFSVEYRAFIHQRRAVALSIYARAGQPESSPGGAEEIAEAATLIGHVLADPRVDLPAGVVLDVGLIDGRGWAVVEANPAWGSALYGCSAERSLPAILASCGH